LKRSQTEIFGLAFIVILLTMGIFFGLFFFVGKKPPPSKGVESVLAANWLNAALNTVDEECQDATLRELYQACAQTNTLLCSTGDKACQRAAFVSQSMLDSTFGEWNRQFNIRVRQGDNQIPELDDVGEACTLRQSRETKTQFVALPGQTPLKVRLDLCR